MIILKQGDKMTVRVLPLIRQGDIVSFTDTWGHVHYGCVVIMTQEDLITLYSPSFKEIYRTFVISKTNGEQDVVSRKMNFDYAVQHSGTDAWKWEAEDETLHS